MFSEGKIRYITEKSPEYLAEQKRRVNNKNGAFGEGYLSEYYRLKKMLGNTQIDGHPLHDEQEKIRKELGDFFKMKRRYLKLYLEDATRGKKNDVLYFFQEALADEEIKNKFKAIGDFGQDDITPEDIATIFVADGKIDDELFAQMVERHVQNFTEKSKEFDLEVEKFKSDFKKRVQDEITAGYLPIIMDKAEGRVDTTKVSLADRLEIDDLASYDNWHGLISDALPEAKRRHAIFHELTHAISGRMITTQKQEVFNILNHQKTGLHFKFQKDIKKFPTSKLAWLNEAVTEKIALKLSQASGREGYYVLERHELEQLLSKGVPEEYFINAYFEDYDPMDKNSKLSAYRVLINKIREVVGWDSFKELGESYGD